MVIITKEQFKAIQKALTSGYSPGGLIASHEAILFSEGGDLPWKDQLEPLNGLNVNQVAVVALGFTDLFIVDVGIAEKDIGARYEAVLNSRNDYHHGHIVWKRFDAELQGMEYVIKKLEMEGHERFNKAGVPF